MTLFVAQTVLRFGVSGLGPEVRGAGTRVWGSAVLREILWRQQSDCASTVLLHKWVVQGVEPELENYGSRAPRSLFVVRGPMTLHIEFHIIGQSCRSAIDYLNRVLKISVLRQWG